MKVWISGGSGSLGRALVGKLKADKIVVYSRTEDKQLLMAKDYPEGGPDGVRYHLGCVADAIRVNESMAGADLVIHAAAQKCIDTCETNVYEANKTNVLGTEVVARACNRLGVKQAIFVSSDKACNPISAYGAQKFLGERIWINANGYGPCKFSVVRWGNVIGSAKSVFHSWHAKALAGETLCITHKDMTRFFWTLDEASQFLIDRIPGYGRGLIYIPKMTSKRIIDVASEYSNNLTITGLRCPEKIHEELVSAVERPYCYDQGDYYVIYPGFHTWQTDDFQGKKVSEDFTYASKVETC